jgi:hypothetical protein
MRPLPDLDSPYALRALCRHGGAQQRFVAFGSLHGEEVLLVAAADVLTCFALDGTLVGSARELPFAVARRKAHPVGPRLLTGGGYLLIVQSGTSTFVDLDSMTCSSSDAGRVRACVSASGQTFAGPGQVALQMWRSGERDTYPPPLPRAVPLAVTDDFDLLFDAAGRISRYEYHRDECSEVASFTGRGRPRCVASPSGDWVAAVSHARARLLSVPSGECVADVRMRDITAVAVGPSGELALGSWNGRVQLIRDGVRTKLRGNGRAVHSLAFSADGGLLAVGSDHARVSILAAGDPAARVEAPDDEILALAAGRGVAAASAGGVFLSEGAAFSHCAGPALHGEHVEVASGTSGPLIATRDARSIRWDGIYSAGCDLDERFDEHLISPDASRVVLFSRPPRRDSRSGPAGAPVLRMISTSDASARDYPVHGPVAFFDADALLVIHYDPVRGTAPAKLMLSSGELLPLERHRLNDPVCVAAGDGGWALSRTNGALCVSLRDGSGWDLESREPAPDNPHSSVPAPPTRMWLDAELLISVRARRVELRELSQGSLQASYLLPQGSRAYALHHERLFFAWQDGDVGGLDLRSGALSRIRLPRV